MIQTETEAGRVSRARSSSIQLAAEQDAAGEHRAAIDTLARATKTGDVNAMTQLGKRLIVGDRAPLLPRDGAGFLIQAANAGGAEAAARLAVLAATGVQVQQSWTDAVKLLGRAAERGWGPAQSQLCALTGGSLTASTNGWRQVGAQVDVAQWLSPPPGRVLNAEPRVCSFEQLIPPAVCEWLVRHAEPALMRARVYDSVSEREALSETRTNSAATFNLMEAELLQILVQARMAAACGLPMRNMEAPAVLHYRVGEQITDHYDFIDPASPNYAAQIARQGQRVITFLAYLNDKYSGGETDFPRLPLRHKGRRGEGLYFVNALEDGAPDRRALHAGLPPTLGEKWIVSQFIRGRALLGLMAVTFVLGLLLNTACFAQSPPESLRACAAVKSDHARLRCYDDGMAALGVPGAGHSAQAGAPASPAPEEKKSAAAYGSPADRASAAAYRSADDFGLDDAALRKKHAADNPEPAPLPELVARVKSVSHLASGELSVQLDNGQVWVETQKRAGSSVAVGQTVTLRPGKLGSYFLSTHSGLALRVVRTQ